VDVKSSFEHIIFLTQLYLINNSNYYKLQEKVYEKDTQNLTYPLYVRNLPVVVDVN